MARQFQLYVFELADAVIARRGVPAKIGSLPYVYVGYTSKPRIERLSEHRVGRYPGDKKWKPYYSRARTDLCRGRGPFASQDEALAAEGELANDLTDAGFTVVNETGGAIVIPSARVRR